MTVGWWQKKLRNKRDKISTSSHSLTFLFANKTNPNGVTSCCFVPQIYTLRRRVSLLTNKYHSTTHKPKRNRRSSPALERKMASKATSLRLAFSGFSLSESNALKGKLQDFNALVDYTVGPTVRVACLHFFFFADSAATLLFAFNGTRNFLISYLYVSCQYYSIQTTAVVVPESLFAEDLSSSKDPKIAKALKYNIPVVYGSFITQSAANGGPESLSSFKIAPKPQKSASESLNDSFFRTSNSYSQSYAVRPKRHRSEYVDETISDLASLHLPSQSATEETNSKRLKLTDSDPDAMETDTVAVEALPTNSTPKSGASKTRVKPAGGKWSTARVFISSTFKDMHGERDYLTRYVFPELQERCDKLRVNIHAVDLRWGITEEDTSNALEICLSEVDSCRPFFLGLLGDRYGWRPDQYVVPDEPRFDWIKAMPPGLSITHLEMYSGALRNVDASNYVFCLRDPDFLRDVPVQNRDDFTTESVEHRYNLDKLREDIRTKCDPSLVFDQYPCSWGGVVDGKALTISLERFGKFVTEALWRHIEKHFGHQETVEADELTAERLLHEQFIESHSRNFVGRGSFINGLVSYCDTPKPSTEIVRPLVVIGEPGAGKTSLMSSFVSQYSSAMKEQDDTFVLFHFVGAAPGSTNIRHVLSRLVHEVTLKFGDDDAKRALASLPEEYKDLKAQFLELIKNFGKTKPLCRLVLILDALNQLEDSYQAHSLDWLPEELPHNVRIVASTLKGAVYDAFQRRPIQELPVGGLSKAECIEIVEKTLGEYRKKLTSQQIELLLRKSDSTKPLYLVVACEELRVFGVFEKLTERIKTMSDNVQSLFAEVLERLEGDHGDELVKTTMSFIACSRGGLLEDEMLHLLGNETDGPIPQSVWSRLFRALKAYLRPSGDVIDFFHQQLPKAVSRRYLKDENKPFFKTIHARLGSYFEHAADPELDQTWAVGHRRGLSFAPYHHTLGECWELLPRSLCNLAFIEAKCELGMTYDLVADYLLAASKKEIIQPPSVAAAIEEYQRFVMQRSHVLALHSDLCFSMAACLPNDSRPAEEAMLRYRGRLETRPWMKWINKPQTANPCTMTLAGHEMVVRGCGFSPTASFIASASDDSKIKIWSSTTGEEIRTLTGHKNSVTCMEYSPDGEYIATGSYDRSIKVWSANTGDEVITLKGHKGFIAALAWSPDGRTLASCGQDRTVRLWKPFSSDATYSDDGSNNCVRVFQAHERPVRAVAWSKSGRSVASGGEDNDIFVWDPVNESSPIVKLVGHGKAVNSLAFHGDYSLASASDDRSVRTWSLNSNSQLGEFKGHHDGATCVRWSGDGNTILSCSHDNVIILWDVTKQEAKASLIGHTGSVFQAVFSPDYKNIVSCSFDRSVKVWAVLDKVENRGHDARILSIAFSPSGRLLATGSRDKTVKIWDVVSGNELRTLAGHSSNVFGVCFSSDGTVLASASRDKTIRLWNVNSGDCWAILNGHTDIARSVDWSPNGRQILSSGDDKKILVWDADKIIGFKTPGDCITLSFEQVGVSVQFGHHKTVSRVRFSPDGRRAVSTSDDASTKLWDTKVDSVPAKAYVKVATFTGHAKPINASSLSPDNNRVVTASDDCTIRCWSAKNAKLVAELKKHTEAVTDVTYTSDGWIFSGSTDATAVLWDSLTFKPAVSFACLSRVCAVAASPQGHVFAVGDGSGSLMILQPVDLPKSQAELQAARSKESNL
jgi:telomerase protein component 1